MLDRSAFIYETIRSLAFPTLTLGFSFRSEGGRHVPRQGPALIVANHQSFLDPIMVGLASPRRLRALARKTLFKRRAFAWLIRHLGAVPVDQEGVAKEGIKAVLGLLGKGEAVVVFPEGQRTADGRMGTLMPGVHLLIKRSLAPIVPMGIAGGFDAMPRWASWPIPSPLFLPAEKSTLAVSVGRPLDARQLLTLPRESLLDALAQEIRKVSERAERLRRK